MTFDSGSMSLVKPPRKESRPTKPSVEKAAPSDLEQILPELSVAEVIELIQSGQAEIAEVIEAERLGKGRKTILALVKGESGKVYAEYKAKSVPVVNPFA